MLDGSKGADFDDPFCIAPVAPSAGGNVDDFPSFFEEAAHQFHRVFVVELFLVFLLGGIVDVPFGIDAEEVGAHAEGDGEKVGDDPLTGDIDNFVAEFGIY